MFLQTKLYIFALHLLQKTSQIKPNDQPQSRSKFTPIDFENLHFMQNLEITRFFWGQRNRFE